MKNQNRVPKIELYRDNFQNFKPYNIPRAQLVIADIPYNIGVNAYGSNPSWYNTLVAISNAVSSVSFFILIVV